MTIPGAYGFGSQPGGAPGLTRGRIHGGPLTGINYPNPFFDVAHTFLPTTVKELFRYCRYYFLTNPLINATVFKLSEYPITDIIIDHDNAAVRLRWSEYFHDHLMYRSYQIECGLDYNTFGNSMTSIVFPFKKHLMCRSCGFTERADKIMDRWTFTNSSFRLTCPKCQVVSDAEAKDMYYQNASGIRLLRWNVEDVDVTYSDVTGDCTYFYNIPGPLRADILIGKKDIVATTPQLFIQALKQQKGVVFNKDNFFHMKRPTLAWQDRGWGTPLLLPVLKDAFYLQLMKKSQEALLLEHIIPLRVLFPQAGSGASDPYTTTNLQTWKEQVAAEIARWRYDSQYIPIMPLPLGVQSIGGDGKALLLFNEMHMHGQHMIMGMGVPREFLEGGLSYAGTNISMRMLENSFIGYMLRQKLQANWVMRTVAHYMDWPVANVRFKPFKMADDIQRKAYLFQLNQAQKVSDTTLLADADLDQEDEDKLMVKETDKRLFSTRKQQLALAEVQGEQQLIMMKYQARAQKGMQQEQGPPAPGEAGGPDASLSFQEAQELMASSIQSSQQPPPAEAPPGAQSPLNEEQRLPPEQAGMDIMQMAQAYAQQIAQMGPQEQPLAIQALEAQSPELAQLVSQMISAEQAGQQGPQVDMRPLPEARAPRRANSPV